MTTQQVQTIRELRDQGYAVSIFTPEELGEVSSDYVEDAMVSGGWTAIEEKED